MKQTKTTHDILLKKYNARIKYEQSYWCDANPEWSLAPIITFEQFAQKWMERNVYLNTKHKWGPYSYQLQKYDFDKPLSFENSHIILRKYHLTDPWIHGHEQKLLNIKKGQRKNPRTSLSDTHKAKISASMTGRKRGPYKKRSTK